MSMEYVEDLKWEKGIALNKFVESIGKVGFQSIELGRAADVMIKMKRDGAKIYLTFTSNMVTSGLRGFFAQIIGLGMADVIVTTVGGIEEDIMKAKGDKFLIGRFRADDVALREKGENRVGNLIITNDSYVKFEGEMKHILEKLYEKKKRYPVSELLREIGLTLDDENSILYQAAKRDVPIFCPAITDGAFGFHLFMFQQDHPDFIVDVVKDFHNILAASSHDDKKGVIALGGGVSKHHAILGLMINGGADYAVYMTTAREVSGSMSAATTDEAKSWGKIKDNSDAATVNGDVSILFPLAMMKALDTLSEEGLV
jgi:deoxyhypusine synthase